MNPSALLPTQPAISSTSPPMGANPAIPLPFETPAWLAWRWLAVGSKRGTLRFDGTTLTFIEPSGNIRFSFSANDIQKASFRWKGWLFIRTRSGQVRKLTFYSPNKFAGKVVASEVISEVVGGLAGSGANGLADGMALGNVYTSSKIAAIWQRVLAPYVSEVGSARSWKSTTIIGLVAVAPLVIIIIIALLQAFIEKLHH